MDVERIRHVLEELDVLPLCIADSVAQLPQVYVKAMLPSVDMMPVALLCKYSMNIVIEALEPVRLSRSTLVSFGNLEEIIFKTSLFFSGFIW